MRQFFLGAFCALAVLLGAQPNDLMIIEYVDWNPGSGWAVKLYNPTTQTVDLSLYRLAVFNGNNSSPTSNEALSGNLNPGGMLIVSNANNGQASADFQACNDDLRLSGIGVNEDDCVALLRNGSNAFVDMVGLASTSVNSQIAGTPNALKWHKLVRDTGNCIRYTSIDGVSANSWPANASVSVSGWTVLPVSCLTPNSTYTAFSQSSALARPICPGDSVLVNGVYVFNEGLYVDTLFNASGCGTIIPINVEFRNQPAAQRTVRFCPEDSILINGQYYPNDTLLQFSRPGSGAGSCDSLITLELVTYAGGNPAYSFSYLNGDSTQVRFEPAQGGQHFWYFGDGDDTISLGSAPVVHQFAAPGTYSVKMVNISSNGCRDSLVLSVEIPLILEEEPLFPNFFSPNGDGVNDFYGLQDGERFPGLVISIYNRNGQLIYRESANSFAWDGQFNGQACPAGTYFYLAESLAGTWQGFLTLIR